MNLFFSVLLDYIYYLLLLLKFCTLAAFLYIQISMTDLTILWLLNECNAMGVEGESFVWARAEATAIEKGFHTTTYTYYNTNFLHFVFLYLILRNPLEDFKGMKHKRIWNNPKWMLMHYAVVERFVFCILFKLKQLRLTTQ